MHWRFSLRLVAILLLIHMALGCTTRRRTHSERTATQQILITEAVDRSLAALQWPPLEGRRVLVKVFSNAAAADQNYLQGAAEAALTERRARVVTDVDEAELVLTVLAGAIGTDHTERLLGTPRLESFIVTVPELALYKSDTQQGFAKVSYVLQDTNAGHFFYRSDSAQATAYVRTRRILFFGRYRTDTTRYDVE